MLKFLSCGVILVVGIAAYSLLSLPKLEEMEFSTDPNAIEQGRYLVSAGGCVSCHQNTDNLGALSGGLALESDFGTFYVPNITPDMESGIGAWTPKEFLLAMKHGRRADGGFYFPAFPYRAYAGLSDRDVINIGSYLMTLEPISSSASAHNLPVWLQDWMMAGWNLAADLIEPQSQQYVDQNVARGAYLARNLGHCGECHTPRNFIGIQKAGSEFAGATLGDSHAEAINIQALSGWSVDDFAFFLFLGMKPDEEYVGGEMEAVIAHNTSQLIEEDRQAMAAFFKFDGPR